MPSVFTEQRDKNPTAFRPAAAERGFKMSLASRAGEDMYSVP
jgi:hypothetical protein